MIRILAFGIVKDIFGAPSVELDIADTNIARLKQLLEEKYPRLKQIASYMIAINNEYATDADSITAKDEVAIIPPVSGG